MASKNASRLSRGVRQTLEIFMNRLFLILDGINSSDCADETLRSTSQIADYAEACGESITEDEARKIQKAGLQWRDEQVNGNGEWSRMRHEAMDALEG